MKNAIGFIIFLLVLTSCEVTEKIYFEEDNSVTYSIESDITGLMKMDEGKNKEELGDQYPLDTIMTFEEFNQWDLKRNNQQISKFDNEEFADLFKDFYVHSKMTDDESKIALFTKQPSTVKLNQVLDTLSTKSRKLKEKEDFEVAFINNLMFGYLFQKHTFNFNGNQFDRKTILDSDSFEKALSQEKDGLGFGVFLMLTKYKTEYHFPKPVKYVSDTTVKLSWDRKTIYIDNQITELIENPDLLDIEIELEK